MSWSKYLLASVSTIALTLATQNVGAQEPEGETVPETAEDVMGPDAEEAAPAGAAEGEGQDGTDVIVVTGIRQSLAEGLQIKRDSTQIIESIVAEDIGKFPDNNVVEALQRVTGVQVTDRAGGEASAVFIRGLPDVTTTWNGRNIFTASGRAFALADVPANLVKRVDIYKTRAAEQLETGLAGQIDVQTRRPFDFDGFEISANGQFTYQEQSGELDPNLSMLVTNGWDTGAGRFGALVNVSYVQTRYRDQSVTAGAMVPFATPDDPPTGFVPLQRFFDGWQPGRDRGLPTEPGSTITVNGEETEYLLSRDAIFASDLKGDRRRPSVVAALQYAPNDNSEYVFEFFYEGFRNETFNNLHFSFADWWGDLGPDPASTIELYPGTNIIKSRTVGAPFGFNSGDLLEQQTDSFVYALNGRWDIGEKLDLTADISYQHSTFESAFIALRTTRVAESITVDFNPGEGIPAFSYGDNALLRDPGQWTVAEFFDNANRADGDAFTVSVDGDYNADWGILKRVSFGARYDDRGASEAQRTQDAPPLGMPLTDFDDGLQYYNEGFFDGRADVPGSWVVANGYYLRRHADEFRSLYQSTVDPGIETSENLELIENFNIDEVTVSAYVQADFEVELFGRPLMVQGGVRYVNVETDMAFTDLITSDESDASQQVDEFLKSATVRYELFDNVILRFNYGETLRRPNFVDLNPNFNLTGDLTDVGYGSGTGGNPDLEAARATNYDIAAEWYIEDDSALYVTLFRREIDGLVVPLTRQIIIPDTGLNTDTFVVTQPVNASDGVLKGIEIGGVYFPDYLPWIFDGLGVQGSLTILDSSQNIPQTDETGTIIGQEETDFFGVSDMSYNVTLAYDNYGIGMRLSYVWRENFLNNNEARLFANPIGIWRRPEKSLDFHISYRLTDWAAVTFDAVNLTNSLSQSYYAFEDAGGPDTHNFGTNILSRTFAFGLRLKI